MKLPTIPKTLGACADRVYALRQERLALQKKVEELQAQETALREHLIATLPKSEASGVAGRTARVTVETRDVPQVADWPAFYAHVRKTNSFELLQRRLTEGAIKERWENGKQVPGVKVFRAVVVSVTKL